MKRGGPLKRRSGLQRKTRVSPVNEARLERLRAEQFGAQADLCRTLPCCACGHQAPSDPAHVRSRGAGGTDRGNVVPLCRMCHNLQHAKGSKALEERHMISLVDEAKRLERAAYPSG